MAFTFTQAQIDQITALRVQGDIAGNYAAAYAYIANVLNTPLANGIPPNADPAINSVYRWLRGAEQANAGQGVFSALIREYTQRQGELRLGRRFSDAEMQVASNRVATNVIGDILNGTPLLPRGTLPTIGYIAERDAKAVGDVLFAPFLVDPNDTAITQNAAWSGTVLFSALGADQTGRLLSAGASTTALDTVDDLKNILFAFDAFDRMRAVLNASYSASAIQSIVGQVFDDARIVYEALTSPDPAVGGLATLTRKSLAGPAVAFVDKLDPNDTLDMLRSAYYGELIRNTTDATFVAHARTVFTDVQIAYPAGLGLERLDTRLGSLAQDAKRNDATGLAYRNALRSLSLFALTGVDYSTRNTHGELDLYNPATGTGDITDTYLTDRATFLAHRITADIHDSTFNPLSQAAYVATTGYPQYYTDQASGYELYAGPFYEVSLTPLVDFNQFRFGSINADTLTGGNQADHLYGDAGNDTLTGGKGNDYLEGGQGTDTYTYMLFRQAA